MDSSSPSCSVIIVGAGISGEFLHLGEVPAVPISFDPIPAVLFVGIAAAKELAKSGIEDVVILEASDRIGGRIRKEDFGGLTVEMGAGWIQGVGGRESNPVWELANRSGLRTCFSDYSNARYNIYDQSGNKCPSGLAADSYNKAVMSAIQELRNQEAKLRGISTVSSSPEAPPSPKTPIELAIDFVLHDFEMAEVEPISTYTDFGEREFLVADERGYEFLLFKMAESFLFTSEGKIVDTRLQLNKVVRELQYSRDGVTVKTEDGCTYNANYVILSVSVGVLQSDLICFRPQLPHMENAYPGSNILVVTLTNEESKRVEAQSEKETLREAMGVLRDIFGPKVPIADRILVPRWWNNRFQRGSYSNYPIFATYKDFVHIKAPVGPIFFTGEHTNERFNGYVHGGYLSGLETSKTLLEEMKKGQKENSLVEAQTLLLEPLLALTESLTLSTQQEAVSDLHKWDLSRQMYLNGKMVVQDGVK
ncbi:hypothetical protein Sjap_012826 [Stephania japonica]|uniref:Amine oxidase domain-containing protein n=1 Tax=Stephania japonica TaxID=461633 RepID=A0AAP0IWW6_9MAGN